VQKAFMWANTSEFSSTDRATLQQGREQQVLESQYSSCQQRRPSNMVKEQLSRLGQKVASVALEG
jgi:hypothetical protein